MFSPLPTRLISGRAFVMAANALLKGSAPASCTSHHIDFAKAGLLEYAQAFAVAIENLVTPEECTALLAAAESTADGKWDQAMVNIGGGEQKIMTDVRNCGRIIWDNTELAGRIQDRILPHLPKEVVTMTNKPSITGGVSVRRREIWHLTRLNERLRFLQYKSSMYFRKHCDGSYVTPDGNEVSFLTVHLYLNGDPMSSKDEAVARRERGEGHLPAAAKEAATVSTGRDQAEDDRRDGSKLVGGATRFFSRRGDKHFDFSPSMGSCIVFQHRSLVHSGEDVIQGTKYTMRTDVMYRKVDKEHE